MPGWPSRSLTGGVWSVNVFPDVNLMARRQPLLDDDIQRDVEALVASLKSETVDVSPPLGSMVEAIWVSTMNFIALGSWNFVDQAGAQRWPVGLAASMCNVCGVPTSRRRVSQARRSNTGSRQRAPGRSCSPRSPHRR